MPRLAVWWLISLLACTGGEEPASQDSSAAASDDTASTLDTGETAGDEVQDGEHLFAQWCASCHGEDGRGSYSGPTLEREVASHTDEDLINTILNGRGDMGPVPVTGEQAALIVGWLRELFPS